MRHCTALRASCSTGVAADEPKFGCAAAQSARASCQWSRATERQVACRRLLSQVQVVLGSFGVSGAAMPQCGPVRLAGSPPACDGATVVLRGPVWSGWVQQQSGAKQLGYLRARLRLKKPSRDLCRLHEAIARGTRRPANFSFDRRSASYKRWPRRCDGFRASSIAVACKHAQQLDRRRPSCKRSTA